MHLTHFRPRKKGPEMALENAVARNIPTFISDSHRPLWAAGSVPVGAGIPDIVVVVCEPQVFALAQVEIPNAHVLAYLRAVRRARLDTIAARMGQSSEVIVRSLHGLIEIDVITQCQDTYSLVPHWRDILPEIVTIEAKVSNWQRALDQAARNRIFAHKSYIALPERIAKRVCGDEAFRQLGIGILGITEDHQVSIIRKSRRQNPKVWSYYYHLANVVAFHEEGVLTCPISFPLTKQGFNTQNTIL